MKIIRQKIKLKNFWFSLINILLFATPTVIFTNQFFTMINGLFFQEKTIDNYAGLLPFWLGEKPQFLNKGRFVFFCLLVVFLYAFFSYLCEWQAEKLIIKISSYLKNRLLRKFRRLPFEARLQKKAEINSLVEIESNLVAKYWVNLWKEMYKGLLSIVLMFYIFFKNRNTEQEISQSAIIFTAFWLIFINVLIYFFNKKSYTYGKISKEEATNEYGLINKEINNSILIDGMGLNSHYENAQQNLTSEAAKKETFYRSITWLGKIIPWNLLINFFPFLLLIFDQNFIGVNLAIIWNALNSCVWAFGYLWNYPDYSSSRSRIESFLSLPEKNDNLTGVKLDKNWKVKTIIFVDVSFRYRGQSQWILKNYNYSFTMGKINRLFGKNGSGKSTILYLLLGMLSPQQGQIILQDEKSSTYNLHQEVNLKYWRENMVAYCSYDNLIAMGSVGQKQLTNINDTLQNKKDARIFLFDEADNALDPENQELFQSKMEKLVKNGKIVINVSKSWEN